MNSLARFAFNSQIGGSVWGGGIAVSGTLGGQMQSLPVAYVPNDFERAKGEKVYETKTRGKAASLKASSLGNVLLVTTDLKLGQESGSPDDTTDFYLPEVVAANEDPEEYAGSYPGACPERASRRRMTMSGRTWQAGTYRYGFNGKKADGEWSGEGNSYAPIPMRGRARVYDGRLGRWMSVDPHGNKFPNFTPYSYVANLPLVATDPDGREIRLVGSQPDIDAFIAILSARTGIDFDEENGVLKYKTPGKITSSNEISKILGDMLIDAIGNPETKTYVLKRDIAIENVEVEFDDYKTGIIDLADFEALESVPSLQAAMIGHVVHEREKVSKYDKVRGSGKGYDKAHESAILNAEAPILREMTGKKVGFLKDMEIPTFQKLKKTQRELGFRPGNTRRQEGNPAVIVVGYFYSDIGFLFFKNEVDFKFLHVREGDLSEIRNMTTGEKIMKVPLEKPNKSDE